MSYNFGHRHLPKQTQEILRQKGRAEKERQKEAEKRKGLLIEDKIIACLKEQVTSLSVNEIAELTEEKSTEVLQILNELSRTNKVELVVDHSTNSPKYIVPK